MTDRPLTVRQVAERAGISRYAVYDAIRDGKLIALRFSPKLLRVQPAEVDRWLNGASTAWGALPSASSMALPSSDTETRPASSDDASSAPHTAASLALDADQPMELIARFLGHRDVSTTARIYARPSTGKLQGVADAVNLSAERAKRR